MKAKSLIYIGLGGVIAYLLLKKSNKQIQDVPQEEAQGDSQAEKEYIIETIIVDGKPKQVRRKINPFFRFGNRNQQVISEKERIVSGIGSALNKKPKEKFDRELNIDVRKGQVSYNEPNLFGIEVPNRIVNLFKGNRKPINVYYANLIRITPLEVLTPVRYRDKTLGNIFVSTIDENNNMIWRNEATGQEVNIIYPTR